MNIQSTMVWVFASILAVDRYYNSLAVRFVLGLAWMPHDTPIDMFIEFVPSLQLTSEPAFAMDSAVGLRYYF